jgi:hypothetical protein
MLVNEVLLEADKEYDLTVPIKYLEKGPDKGMFNKGRKGKIKHAVQQIQFFLNAKGYPVGKADGWYGKKTATGVRAFQKDKGLKPDGDVGKNTLLAMIQTDQPDLSDKPDSAEITSKEYPKDYIEQQYKKLKQEPDSAKQLFAAKPDMTDALKATLQGIQKAMNADEGDDVKIFNLPMLVNMTNIDMVLKNTEQKIIKNKTRPIWIKQLIKGLKDAAVHARISPKYIDKVTPIVQQLNKINKQKRNMADVMKSANDNWSQKNFNVNFEKFHIRLKDEIDLIDNMLTNLTSQTDVRKLPKNNLKAITTVAKRSVDAKKIANLVDTKTAIEPSILLKLKKYYEDVDKMRLEIDRARKAAGLRVSNDIIKPLKPSYSPSDDGTRPEPFMTPSTSYKPRKPDVPPSLANPSGRKLNQDPIPSVQQYMK